MELINVINKIWNHYDKDKNGVLQGSEYNKFIKELCAACKMKGYEKNVADFIDKNHDGKI